MALGGSDANLAVESAAHGLGSSGRITGALCLELRGSILSALSHTPCCSEVRGSNQLDLIAGDWAVQLFSACIIDLAFQEAAGVRDEFGGRIKLQHVSF